MVGFEKRGALLLALLGFLSQPVLVTAAQRSFDIDIKELDQEKPAPAKAAKEAKPQKAPAPKAQHPSHPVKASPSEDGYVRYKVKPGDHIFKILMADFGMSNEQAERLIPEIVRLNDIDSIKGLKVGKVLLIPTGHSKHASVAPKHVKARKQKENPEPEEKPEPREKQEQPVKEVEAAPALAAVAPPPAKPEIPMPPPAPVPAPAEPAHEAAHQQAPPKEAPAVAVPLVEPKKELPPPAPPAVVSAPLPQPGPWVCSVSKADPHSVVDAIMNVLALKWSKNTVVRSEEGAATAFSVMVDRYFELKGTRYIVTVGETDPYNYTLLRLLETSGYKVLRLKGGEEFQAVGEKFLRLVGMQAGFGKYPIAGGGVEKSGFLIGEDDAGGRRVLVTREPVSAQQKSVRAAGCAGN